MVAVDALDTIRRLSQYRPFERGGASALEAQEDLLLAAIAEVGGSVESVAEARDAVSLFNLTLDEVEIARALDSLAKAGAVEREGGQFVLTAAEAERLAAVAAESGAVADAAIAEWLSGIAERFPGLSESEEVCLRTDLDAYLRAVIQRHGAEAALLLYPDDPVAERLYGDLEEMGTGFLGTASRRVEEIRQYALHEFIRRPTDVQRRFLAQNLSTGYFWTVLSIDPEGARLVQELARGQRVYLDTNFVFRLLGIQGPRHIRPAELLLDRTSEAGYEVAVTRWTIDELQRRLKASRDYLRQNAVPPSEYASLAADAASDDDFVTFYWRRVKDEPGLSVDDFLAYYEQVEDHLKAHGILVRDEGCTAVDQRKDDIGAEVSLLERVLDYGRKEPLKEGQRRWRPTRTLEHDAKHRLLIERRRGDGHRTFANANSWFMTYDSLMPRYDYHARRGSSALPFCVTAGSWFQVVEAFKPKSDDLGAALADLLASPYVRYRRTLSKGTAQAIAARTHMYRGGTPELAARVFMDTAALEDIEQAATPEEQTEKIDNALIAATQEMREEARRAKAQAEDARERARQREEAAETAVRASEQRRLDELEREKALRDEAVRNEAARGTSAVEHAKANAQRAQDEQRERYEQELADARDEASAQAEEARRAQRRIRLVAIFGVVLALAFVAGLAFGFGIVWGVVSASAILITVVGGLRGLAGP
jgi:predicted nucleic acid-binding protein